MSGVDSTLAYTNKDYERVAGDAALRKQVKLPKDKLGVCISLAMETNGNLLHLLTCFVLIPSFFYYKIVHNLIINNPIQSQNQCNNVLCVASYTKSIKI